MSPDRLIFSLPRTGSQMLCRVLNSIQGIACIHEAFQTIPQQRDPAAAIESFRKERGQSVIAECKYGVRFMQIKQATLDLPLRKIHLVRRDRLAATFSDYDRFESAPAPRYSPRLKTFQAIYEDRVVWESLMSRCCDYELAYEDLTAGGDVGPLLSEAFDLDIPTTHISKEGIVHPEGWEHYAINHRALKKALGFEEAKPDLSMPSAPPHVVQEEVEL